MIVVVIVLVGVVVVANDHLEDPASCKRSSEESGLFQMIIQRTRPLANDQSEDLATCK